MVSPNDRVICAVSGGADSVALLFAMYLLREKLDIRLEAAHFNHNLRGAESDRDEDFVRAFCNRYDIPLLVGSGTVRPGKKGLEAAARTARYDFLRTLGGKIATAHTADDNAETVLMHMLRGTGLHGLGGITPVTDNLIRPMLNVTREDVLAFLQEYNLTYVCDSSNGTDQFLRNRLRHHCMPFFAQENPNFVSSVSQMAQRLRRDEAQLSDEADHAMTTDVFALRSLKPAIRTRVLHRLLVEFGMKEPETEHILLLERVVFSKNPSAKANFPGNIVIGRNYNILQRQDMRDDFVCELPVPGSVVLQDQNLCVTVQRAGSQKETFIPEGIVRIRSRKAGDEMRLSFGTKRLKKLFVDKKIPAHERNRIPVIADDRGVIYVHGFGMNLDRLETGTMACSLSVVELLERSEEVHEK